MLLLYTLFIVEIKYTTTTTTSISYWRWCHRENKEFNQQKQMEKF